MVCGSLVVFYIWCVVDCIVVVVVVYVVITTLGLFYYI